MVVVGGGGGGWGSNMESNKDIEEYLSSQPNRSNNDILGMDVVLLRESDPYIS